jgi:hypothetical protein
MTRELQTVVYSDGTSVTGTGPLPKRSPAQQQHDHMCSLRRQLRFLERTGPGHRHAEREIAALRWAIDQISTKRAEQADTQGAP